MQPLSHVREDAPEETVDPAKPTIMPPIPEPISTLTNLMVDHPNVDIVPLAGHACLALGLPEVVLGADRIPFLPEWTTKPRSKRFHSETRRNP